jgi:hypothetical protein
MMTPDLPQREKLVTNSISLMARIWDGLATMVEKTGAKSRNALMGGYMEFCLGFFPRIKSEKRIREIAAEERKSLPEMMAELVELGRAAYEKEKRSKR